MIYIDDRCKIAQITYDRDSRIIIDSNENVSFELSIRYFEKTNKISYVAVNENRKKTTVLLSAKKDLYIQIEYNSLTLWDKPHEYRKYFVLSTRGITRIDKRKVNYQVLSSKIYIGSTDDYPMHIEKYCDNLRVRYSDGTAVLLCGIEPGYIYLINTHKRCDECDSSRFIAPKSRRFNTYNIAKIYQTQLNYDTNKFHKIADGLYGVFPANYNGYTISHDGNRFTIQSSNGGAVNPSIDDLDIVDVSSFDIRLEKTKYIFCFNIDEFRCIARYTHHKKPNTIYQLYFYKSQRNAIRFGEVEWTTIL